MELKEKGQGAGGEKDWPRHTQLPLYGISACILFKAEPGVSMTVTADGTRKESELASGYITEMTTAAHGWTLTSPPHSRDKGSLLVASPQLSHTLLLFTSIHIKLFSAYATHIW